MRLIAPACLLALAACATPAPAVSLPAQTVVVEFRADAAEWCGARVNDRTPVQDIDRSYDYAGCAVVDGDAPRVVVPHPCDADGEYADLLCEEVEHMAGHRHRDPWQTAAAR